MAVEIRKDAVGDVVGAERIREIGRELQARLPEWLAVEENEDGIIVREKDGDRILGKSVLLTEDGYKGEPFNALCFNGEASKENGYRSACASIIPKTEHEARGAIRFAIACAFNVDVGHDF